MAHNRISGRLTPGRSPNAAALEGFVACPAMLRPTADEAVRVQQELYRRAMEQAAAVVRPAITERWTANLLN